MLEIPVRINCKTIYGSSYGMGIFFIAMMVAMANEQIIATIVFFILGLIALTVKLVLLARRGSEGEEYNHTEYYLELREDRLVFYLPGEDKEQEIQWSDIKFVGPSSQRGYAMKIIYRTDRMETDRTVTIRDNFMMANEKELIDLMNTKISPQAIGWGQYFS